RRADPADIPALAALVVASGDDGGDPAGLPARLARLLDQATHALFLAEGDNGPCGFAAAEHRLAPGGECVVLTCLAVDAAARRRGVERVQVSGPLAHGDAHGSYPALGYEAFDTRRVYRRDLR